MAELIWEHVGVPLKFRLGGIVLGSIVLSLFRRSARLDEHPLDVGDAPEPPPCLDEVDGYVVWSQPIAKRLPVLSARRDAILDVPYQYRRFTIDLSGGFEQYMLAFSGKTRSSLKRKLRKFAEAGGVVDWKEYRTLEEIGAFFPLARRVSVKTYQERILHSGLPDTEEFVEGARALSREDGVRVVRQFDCNNAVWRLTIENECGTKAIPLTVSGSRREPCDNSA